MKRLSRGLPLLGALLLALAVGGALLGAAILAEERGAPVEVRFSGEVMDDLPVSFGPMQEVVKVEQLGEPHRAMYRLKNLSDETISVQPVRRIEATRSVAAIQIVRCYCWLTHKLGPGEEVELPVWFIVGNGLLGQPPGDFHIHWSIHSTGEEGVGRVATSDHAGQPESSLHNEGAQ